MDQTQKRILRYNLVISLLDGGFFGLAIGFASFSTVIPLFVSRMTTSAALIGLVPAIHNMGWQLPQLLIARRVARQPRYKPMVMGLTIHERLPFLGLALVAWFQSSWEPSQSVWLIYLLLIWQGLGGGFAAIAWQSMIGKIIPPEIRGTFYGLQASASNLLASGSAVIAGYLLARLPSPYDFISCFVLAFIAMALSYFFLSNVREEISEPLVEQAQSGDFMNSLKRIMQTDSNFRWFLLVRILSQIATGGFAFYTVYAVRFLGVDEITIGVMTGVLMGTQIIANPLMGWLGDRYSYRRVMALGIAAALVSTLLAWQAHTASLFYAIFILAGIANVGVWTIGLALTLEFGSLADRPAYIGLANTLVAPATFLAPYLIGWLADLAGYPASFLASSIGSLLTLAALAFLVRDPPRDGVNKAPAPITVITE